MRKILFVGLFLMVAFVFTAYNAKDSQKQAMEEEGVAKTSTMQKGEDAKEEQLEVNVDLINVEGEVTGKATLTEVRKGVNIDIEAWDLTKGAHGFHFHEKGLCEPPTFESAGSHFNPTNAEHGFDNPEGPHAGDLPNLEVGEDGQVHETVLAEMVTLKRGEKNSLLREGGTSLVIHADPDDYISQPAGNSGDRIACGVVND